MKKAGLFKNALCILAAVTLFSFTGCGLFGSADEEGPASVYITQSVIELEVGQTLQLQAVSTDDSEVVWVSGDEEVATVEDGLVTALNVGECLIIAVGDSAQTSCTLKVKEKQETPEPVEPVEPEDPEVFVLSLSELTLEVGKSVTMTATSKLEDEITWTSLNPSVASVLGGKVTAHKVGETMIMAYTAKVSARCTVKVVEVSLPDDPDMAKDGYRLVWNDEFNGNSLDTTKWGYQTGTQDHYGSTTGPAYWGNDELQYYTQDAVSVSDGALKITATRQQMGDRPYTSARLLTRDKASWTYGYFEARMKTPTGNGMWPAFWMLPQPSSSANSNNEYGGWAANGEIDIMEAKGSLMNKVDTTIHFGGPWPENTYLTNEATLSSNTDQWHTYAVEWTADYIAWIVDGNQVYKLGNNRWYSTAAPDNPSAPFDKPFYILLNLAVGGKYDSYKEPDGSFVSASMYVDYVRVYEKL